MRADARDSAISDPPLRVRAVYCILYSELGGRLVRSSRPGSESVLRRSLTRLTCAAGLALLLAAGPARALKIRTGPEVGQPVPDFTLPDQNGRRHSLRSLMGKKGVVIVFHRSADW